MRFFLLGAAVLGFLTAGSAQTPAPVEKEPHHHVVLENSYVRVLDLILQPGESTGEHVHSHDTLQVMVGPSKMQVEVQGKPPAEVAETKPGDVGYIAFSKNPVTHRVKNTGTSTLHLIEIEFLASPNVPAATPFQQETPSYKMVLDNDRLRVFRRVLPPGETSNTHTHQRPLVGINVTGGSFYYETTGQPARTVEVPPASVGYPKVPFTHMLKNVGKTTAISLDIELK